MFNTFILQYCLRARVACGVFCLRLRVARSFCLLLRFAFCVLRFAFVLRFILQYCLRSRVACGAFCLRLRVARSFCLLLRFAFCVLRLFCVLRFACFCVCICVIVSCANTYPYILQFKISGTLPEKIRMSEIARGCWIYMKSS